MSFFTLSLYVLYGLVVILNFVFAFSWTTLLNVFICLVIIMLPAAVFLFVGRALPKNWFDSDRGFFKVNKFQTKICDITKVKKWKDKIPVGGHVAGFRLNQLTNPKDLGFLNRFIYESCFAEWLHSTCAIWGILSLIIIYFINKSLVLPMALPIAIIFAYQNMVSTIIQWHTRPRITKLRNAVIDRNKSKNITQTEIIKF